MNRALFTLVMLHHFSVCLCSDPIIIVIVIISDYINHHYELNKDAEAMKYLPINEGTNEMFQKIDDGILLW